MCKFYAIKALFFISFAVAATTTFAQTGAIKGTIKTSDYKSAEYVNVIIKGLSGHGAISGEKGEYEFRKLAPGSYVVVASFVGLQTKEQSVEVKAGETAVVDFILDEDSNYLNEVIVTGNRPNKYANKNSDFVSRMPLANLENPQVYTVVTKELLKDQVAVSINDALTNIPGAAVQIYPAGGLAITSRGFATGINARNGLETTATRSSVEIANLETIEAIKGPSGTLFGSSVSSFGGVVNIVTKKPFETFKGEVSYSAGSFGLNRFTADVNTPLNDDKTVLFRINTAVNQQNSFLDYGHNNTVLVAPSILCKVNDRLTLTGDLEYFHSNQTRIVYTRVTPESGFTNPSQIPLAYNQSLFLNDANALTTANKLFLQGKYTISDHWTSTTLFSFTGENVDHSYQYYPTWISPTLVGRDAVIYGPIFNNYTSFQENINGEFSTGVLKHKLLVGLSYRYYNAEFNYAATNDIRYADTVDITKPFRALNKAQIDQYIFAYGQVNPYKVSNEKTPSAYVADVINFNDRLFAMLSVRFDRFKYSGTGNNDSYNQTSVSPKLGLVYQLVKNQLSVFGNYMSGFQNNAPTVQPDGKLFVIKPTFANQAEGGLKAEAFEKKLNFSVSYYYIKIANAVRYDAQGFALQDGQQVSKGIETELIVNPAQGLNIVVGYAHNENRVLKTDDETVNGNYADSAPVNVANVWATYKFHGVLNGLGLGFGGNYVGRAFMTTANTYYIPECKILNTSVFYDHAKWRLDLKFNNIGNEKNWDLTGSPRPRANVVGSLTIKF